MFLPLLISLLLTSLFARAENLPYVEHHDPMVIDAQLSLPQLVDLTLEKYPDAQWLLSLENEANAIKQRGDSWTSAASQAFYRFQEASSLHLHYNDATVQISLWNIGQRDANQRIGDKAQVDSTMQAAATKWRVAGLVRGALWDISLQELRLQQVKMELAVTEQLAKDVKRRVQAGDLAETDSLLAQTEVLQKRSVLTLAEAEVMHARKRFSSITQSVNIPANFHEVLTAQKEIEPTHPALQAINSQIERKYAELEALQLVGSGQSSVVMGISSDRYSKGKGGVEVSNNMESLNIGVTVPFGGEAHLAPQVAAMNVELSKLRTERDQLVRDLEQAHHEAEHNLQVNQAELIITNELKTVAEKHLKMTQLSFSVGEIDLIDLLKIQSQTQLAILNAKERTVIVQRDFALYNQAVGVLP
ncbi:MAG: TolC family protein [Methylococcales bacterium]|jgi:outer membrane protein, heavy metal efflux system|nr:TolC family protein [Methylococcales bacterium]